MKPIEGEDVNLPEVTGDELDHTPITFGKYKGLTPSEIAMRDPKYIVYMFEFGSTESYPKSCSKALYEDCLHGLRDNDTYPDSLYEWDQNMGDRW